jgi:hypothetical protein
MDMTWKGHVENGAIVLDDPVELPEGAIIRLEIETAPEEKQPVPLSFAERFADVMGKAQSLPEDAAENHDHYLRKEHTR